MLAKFNNKEYTLYRGNQQVAQGWQNGTKVYESPVSFTRDITVRFGWDTPQHPAPDSGPFKSGTTWNVKVPADYTHGPSGYNIEYMYFCTSDQTDKITSVGFNGKPAKFINPTDHEFTYRHGDSTSSSNTVLTNYVEFYIYDDPFKYLWSAAKTLEMEVQDQYGVTSTVTANLKFS